MGWLELALKVVPFVVQAVEAVGAATGANGAAKKSLAINLLDALLPQSPAAAAPNRAAAAPDTFGQIVDDAVSALNLTGVLPKSAPKPGA